MTYANNKGADQPEHPHSLFSTFVIGYLDSTGAVIEWLEPLAVVRKVAGSSPAWAKDWKTLIVHPECMGTWLT